MSFENKNVLVVGASGALGSRISQLLKDAGAYVIGTASTEDSLSDIPESANRKLVADLANPHSIQDAIASIDQASTGIDGVVVASGVVGFALAEETDPVQAALMMQINHLGPTQVINGLFPKFQAAQGFVCGIPGVVADQVFPGMSAYCASKVAHGAYLQTVTKEWRRHKVRVIDVRIGHTETGLATRPLFGNAPTMPAGHSADDVAQGIIRAIEQGTGIYRDADLFI